MFEVGKKYLMGDHASDIYECIAIHESKGWLVLNGKPLTYDWTDNCKEYKGPRTITRWVNVYSNIPKEGLSFGHMYEDETKARANGYCNGAIATIPITYTEPH